MKLLAKLNEALAEIDGQRKAAEAQLRALTEMETKLRAMIAQLMATNGSYEQLSLVSVNIAQSPTQNGDRDRLADITDILRTEGQPMHISAIVQRLTALTGKQIDRQNIEPGLNRHIKTVKARRVDKFGPSTFGLPEWKTSAVTH